ncbi:putative bifunctional diguanylate cyclase/phosphodiesterase [Paraburkholderia rhizosphaerae]|uniref:Diguanylate cyclase (GGDEF)-like protein n=1 Tax=Paraburkholderia rhizosphaerae TaxID=480658 RepID=A0A4R8LVI2_9BURK|nr:EAL domain-containing protein [Paraburkholderia rhizosphaerae]TDY50845.1 diguanylate cyclase (GGDEF)-like protein [Paraburkholderia rhizosphaerae]
MNRQDTADRMTDSQPDNRSDREAGSTHNNGGYRSTVAAQVLESERAVLRLLTRSAPLPELLAEVCRRAEALLGDGAACSVLVLDPDGRHAKVGAAPSLPPAYCHALGGFEIGPRAGSCGTAMYERRMVVAEDIDGDPLWTDHKHLTAPHGLRACWSIPFEDEAGGVLGAFAVYHYAPRRPTDVEETILRDIGRSVGLAIHQDRIRQRLAQSEEHHRLVVDHLNEGIVVQSRDGEVLACNPSAMRMLRATPAIIGANIHDVLLHARREDGSVIESPERPTLKVLSTGKPVLGVTMSVELAIGETIWVIANFVPIFRPGEPEPGAVLVSFNDIGPVRAAQRQLKYLATRDPLTGLYNRAYLSDRMRDLLGPPASGYSGGEVPRVAVLFVDLDGFKKVNDTAGHEAGDALLCSVARRLAACVHKGDTLARVGGDEFVIAVSGYESAAHLTALARQILETVAMPFAVADNEYYLGASIGISVCPEDGRDATTLMRNADSAMYQAKQRGRNGFEFFTKELSQQLQRRFAIEQSLRRALAADELRLVYQPIVDGVSGRTIGAEALMRWHNEALGDVSPIEFIPVAEDTGLIVTLGRWLLERACAQAAEWRKTIAPDLTIAVNLSPRQFNDGLVQEVAQSLSAAGLDPGALELEITEGLLMSERAPVMPMLHSLSRMGVRISVDDFGTGYSSLSYLKRFPLHNLKVDRSFVAGLPDHRDAVAITHAVVAMAHSLGMNVTAEGVETSAQSAFLRSIGCDRQQGYLFGRPVAPGEYTRRLTEVVGQGGNAAAG